jgi:hypothetical protein
MAESAAAQQYSEIYTLAVVPGIKRDGTQFESGDFTEGVWCRFQRGKPKKIGGYRTLFHNYRGITRGMIVSPQNGVNYIFGGNSEGIDVFTTGTTIGLGSGPYEALIYKGYGGVSIVSVATPNFIVASDLTTVYKAGTKVCFSQAVSPTIYTVVSSSYNVGLLQTTVVLSTAIAGSPTTVYLADYQFAPNDSYIWQFDIQYSPSGGVLNLLACPGVNLTNIDSGRPTQVLIGSLTPDANDVWSFSGLVDSAGQNPTYRPIAVDGGVCVLYPYIFVYGSNGFIANNHVDSTYASQSPYDWNGATANQVNMAASKIVLGKPTRGGTNSPSGLFWATDSLIRVSFTGAAPYYWRYDIVSSQISIMSSSSVVEMDGTFYWMGVDRFYVYNGQVAVLPNDKNVNWLFNNLNYTQRQKVWATKVPRYNEIWFFYPRGTATECTDAIIYNVKDKIWYDAGSANGAQRSSGWTTEIFPTPIWADWNFTAAFSQPYVIIATPGGQPAPTAKQIYLAGDATQTFSPGDYLSFSNNTEAVNFIPYRVITSVYTYVSGSPTFGYTLITLQDVINPAVTTGDYVYYISGGYTLWQQEFGLNAVGDSSESAIYSSFTTADISWIGGTPAQDSVTSVNRRMHIRRFEPDFVQDGDMLMTVLGRKFASSEPEVSGPFTFSTNTGKIDLRVEHRLVKLKFESNCINGNYEMGRNMITAEFGDERP